MAITLAIVVPPGAGDLRGIARDRHGRDTWPRAVAEVLATYEAGRHLVPIRYADPTTGQTITRSVVVNDDDLRPTVGGSIVIAVQPSNPDRVVIPDDGDALLDILFVPFAVLVVVALAAALRLLSVRRTERLIESGGTSFVMLAVLRRSRWRPNGVRCSLYPLDASPGTPPVCTFDVLTTGGLPIDAPATAVEVRGRPVPGGLLVARCGDCIVRPLRRPATRGAAEFDGRVVESPTLLGVAPAPGTMRSPVPAVLRCVGMVRAGLVLATLIATVVGAAMWGIGVRDDRRLVADGTAVLAEVIANDGDTITVQYPPPGGGPQVVATLHGSPDRVVGRIYPAHADAAGDVRLDADPYNWIGPLVWLLSLWGVVAMFVWPRLRWWRDARRAARTGPWYAGVARREPDGDRIGPSSDVHGTFVVRCRKDSRFHAASVPCSVAGSLEPGDAFAVSGRYRAEGPVTLVEWFGVGADRPSPG